VNELYIAMGQNLTGFFLKNQSFQPELGVIPAFF